MKEKRLLLTVHKNRVGKTLNNVFLNYGTNLGEKYLHQHFTDKLIITFKSEVSIDLIILFDQSFLQYRCSLLNNMIELFQDHLLLISTYSL